MKRCCKDKEQFQQEVWDELVNSITMRHGVYEVEFPEVVSSLTAEDRANAKVLAKLEKVAHARRDCRHDLVLLPAHSARRDRPDRGTRSLF